MKEEKKGAYAIFIRSLKGLYVFSVSDNSDHSLNQMWMLSQTMALMLLPYLSSQVKTNDVTFLAVKY